MLEHRRAVQAAGSGNPVSMGSQTKGLRPQVRNTEPTLSPETSSGTADTAPQGRFDGLYRLDGFTLRRGDGLALVTCYRPGDVGPRGSNRYLALASSPARPFVGNLYRAPGLDGAEFDDKVHRYRIERVDAERYRIRTLYRKGARPARRVSR